jgi:hypothetical protein
VIEDESLWHLHDCSVDRSQFLCHSPNLVLRYSTLTENDEGHIEIWELPWIVACFRVVGRDVGGLCGRVSVDTIAGQDFLPSQSPALLGLEALVLNPIGSYVAKLSPGARFFEEGTRRGRIHRYLVASSRALASSSSSEMNCAADSGWAGFRSAGSSTGSVVGLRAMPAIQRST